MLYVLKYKKKSLMIRNSIFVSTAGRYARALFNVGMKKNCIEQIQKSYNEFLKIDKRYMTVLNTINSDGAINSYCNALIKYLNEEFIRFIKWLTLNKKIYLLGKIYTLFNILVDDLTNRKKITVYTACDIPTQHKNTIVSMLNNIFKETLNTIEFKINNNLLTGIVIQCDGTVYDVSGRNFLQQLNNFI